MWASYLQDGPPALGCMLAAGWAAPGNPMQGQVAVRAHTVGAVVVIDEAGSEFGTLSTDHLEWQVGKRSLIPVGPPFQCTNSPTADSWPLPNWRMPSQMGLQAASLSPP